MIASLVLLLACRGRSKGPDIGALIADLQNPDPEVSGKASVALVRIGEPAVPSLIAMLNSWDCGNQRSHKLCGWAGSTRA